MAGTVVKPAAHVDIKSPAQPGRLTLSAALAAVSPGQRGLASVTEVISAFRLSLRSLQPGCLVVPRPFS
jgi:hypothetical protein